MEQPTSNIHLVVFTTISTISVLGMCNTLTKGSYIAYFFNGTEEPLLSYSYSSNQLFFEC
jgi:hypothetical protein